MKFQLDTETKTITLLEKVPYETLKHFIENQMGEKADEWNIDFALVTVTIEKFTPWPQWVPYVSPATLIYPVWTPTTGNPYTIDCKTAYDWDPNKQIAELP